MEWLAQIRATLASCERRRQNTRKPKTTGTLSEAACLCLKALTVRAAPTACVEIGTFIGTSALVMASEGACVYTCDRDNAAFASHPPVVCFQKTTSTTMLRSLLRLGVQAQQFFFDGRIQVEDIALITALSAPGAIYAFDDFEGREKGVINVDRLRPALQGYRLEPPAGPIPGLAGRSTIAALVPRGWA